jgi:alpha-L-fucosidase 2
MADIRQPLGKPVLPRHHWVASAFVGDSSKKRTIKVMRKSGSLLLGRAINVTLVSTAICACGLAITARGAGRYLTVNYEASTDTNELQIPVTYTLWIPDGVSRLRGIIVHQHGAGTTASIEGSTAAYDLQWQALATKWDCSLFCSSYHVSNEKINLSPGGSELWFDPRHGSEKTFLRALDDFADQSGHPEIKRVPWALWGHSGGGIWADVMARLHPHRVIAMWLRSGSAAIFRTKPEFPQPDAPAAVFEIPTMCNPGMKEQFALPFVGTLATFQEFRSHGAPIGFAPDPRTGHECGDSRYLAIPFFDACLAMRLPDRDSTNQSLKAVDMSQAWLAPLMSDDARPAREFKGDPDCAVWLPNKAIAKAWMEYVKTGDVSDTTPPPPPYAVKAEFKGNSGVAIIWQADADFESGIRNFIVLRDGQEIAQVPENPIGKFGRPLFQSMTYHDTPAQPLPEMRYVDSSVKTGEQHSYTVITVNSVGLKSVPSWPSSTTDSGAGRGQHDMALWYRQPAKKWLDALPIGNGYMGAMVFGGLSQERIALNESSFWSGRPHDYNDTNAFQYFPQIRDLVFAGQFQAAEKMADDHFWGIPKAQQAYEPIGDLLLDFDGADKAQDYRRELDMETGVTKLSYRVNDTTFTREVLMSYPEHVMVVRLSSDKPGRVSVEARLKSPFLDHLTATANELIMDGSWKAPGSETNWLIAPVAGTGLRFETAMLARPEGGNSEATGDGVRIHSADAVTFILTTATSYVNYTNISADPSSICGQILSRSAAKDYELLRHRHESDFRGLMGRVHLDIGDPAMNNKPTDERLAAFRAGTADPNLEALVFQFGRYLLAASSRAGGQPANLQGIWSEDVIPPWGSKYTININTEMNYWPAEVCNLSECAQPLFDMIKDISVNGRETARVYYDCGGWVTHHNIDLWRGTAPVDAARFGMWPVGGAWLCQHVWEHYAFTSDQQFLREYYPVLKGAAEFLLEVMVEEPKHHWLVTPFSMSPEHAYFDANGKSAVLSPSPTMDLGIIRELFPHCIEATRILGVDPDFHAKLETALTKIPPYQIGKAGFVQEWIEDWKPGPQGHNVSPNFPFYPGSSLILRGNPDYAEAYQKWMEAHPPRGGFPLSWGIAMWARLERGDEVESLITNYMKRAPANNLHNSGSNQSDASFGFTAAVAEALLQSHAGEISLLPALPPDWKDGSIHGLRARGDYEVNMQWKNGKLTFAEISNVRGGDFKVRSGDKTASFALQPGRSIRLNSDLVAVTQD